MKRGSADGNKEGMEMAEQKLSKAAKACVL